MPLQTRTVTIALKEQTANAVKLRFLPVLSGADGEVLLSRFYEVTTDTDGTGTIDLPVPSTGSFRYSYEIPGTLDQVERGTFSLAAGAAIGLDELIAAGAPVTDSVQAYVDQKISEAMAHVLTFDPS